MLLTFNFPQSDFTLKDLGNALVLVRMSELSYRDGATIERELAATWGAQKAQKDFVSMLSDPEKSDAVTVSPDDRRRALGAPENCLQLSGVPPGEL